MKKFVFLLIPIIAFFIILGSSYFVSKKFDAFLDAQFISEVTSDALTLHYSLKEPSDYGIDVDTLFEEGKYLPSWNATSSSVSLNSANSSTDVTSDNISTPETASTEDSLSTSSTQNTSNNLSQEALCKLKKFPRLLLHKGQKIEYDILLEYLTLENELSQFELYEEPLSISSGTHCELPILLSEYDFNCKEDIDIYFKILNDIPQYFDGLIAFETAKADAGLFMSDHLCIEVINQCEEFESSPLLVDSFNNRINETDFLTDTEKTDYIDENSAIVTNLVMPSYTKMASDLTSLLGKGRNSLGLYYAPEGIHYYELLVKKYTGSDKSVEELFSDIENARTSNFDNIAELAASPDSDVSLSEILTESSQTLNPEDILNNLQLSIQKDFPVVDNFCYTVSSVDSSLSAGLAPAFYIVPPCDDYTNNRIYINSACDYADIQFFTTLAHEGLPGHMYQHIMSHELDLKPYRTLLCFDGFSEGWATYTEFLSYEYAGEYMGLNQTAIDFLKNEAAASLSLYATTDIGVNYYGWDYAAVEAFWSDYGIDDPDTILSIMDLVIADPANYLKYYGGYLEIENLKSQKEAEYDNFSLGSFHKALLDIGPAQFDIIDKYFDDFYCNNCW